MKAKGTLLIGLMLGTLIGWALGFLRLPYLEHNFSFWVGFMACLAFVSLGIILSVVWSKNTPLNRLIGKEAVIQASKNPTNIFAFISLLVVGFIVLGILFWSFWVYKQNALFRTQSEDQNKKMQEMTGVIESFGKSNLAFMMRRILNDVADELKHNPNGTLTDTLIARIATLTASFKPYRYFEGDSLSRKELSPERGQFLLALCLLKIDSSSFAKIKLSASFSGADLRDADLKDADLSVADLKNADLKNADLTGANLQGTNLSSAVLWGATFTGANFTKADLKRADLRWAQLNDTDLKSANLNGADLTNAQMRKADLTSATLQWTQSGAALFTDANLSGVDFLGANLTKANLSQANLSKTDLRTINLSESDLTGAELNSAIVDENWGEKLNEWRLTGLKQLQESYKVVNDSTDKWKKPIYRLRKK